MKIFNNVLLSSSETLSAQQQNLFSCIKFVADHCSPVCFYFNKHWSDAEILRSMGQNPEAMPPEVKALFAARDIETVPYTGDMPQMLYMSYDDWGMVNDKRQNLPAKIPKNEFILSNNVVVNKAALEMQGINSNTAVLCLAAAGLDLMLPNVSFNLVADDEVERIRETLYEERIAYLSAVSGLADAAFDRLASGDFDDIMLWARNEVTFKILPKARVLGQSASKLNKTTLRQAGHSFWTEGIPVIGKGYMDAGLVGATKATAEEMIKMTCSLLGKDYSQRHLPEISYALKINRQLTG